MATASVASSGNSNSLQSLLNQINGVKATTATTAASTTTAGKTGTANEQSDRFLKLLVAQMSHQDPLNPLDNAQVTSQMAQISTVEGISKLNDGLTSLLGQSSGLRPVDAAGLLGKSALVAGDTMAVDGSETRFALQVDSDTPALQVQIFDESGNVVRTMNMSNVAKGVQPVTWDGKTNAGLAAPAGNYSFKAIANPEGNPTKVVVLTPARVNAVVGDQTNLKLDLQGYGLKSQSDIKGFI